MKIGAKIASHGRDVTFQMAEVAIPRRLFAEILRLIDSLQPKLAPTWTEARQATMPINKRSMSR